MCAGLMNWLPREDCEPVVKISLRPIRDRRSKSCSIFTPIRETQWFPLRYPFLRRQTTRTGRNYLFPCNPFFLAGRAKFCRTSQQVPKGHIWKEIRIAKGRGKLPLPLIKVTGNYSIDTFTEGVTVSELPCR